MEPLFDLTGKVAIVTGGAGWLGTSITEAMAQAGALVVCIDYNKNNLELLAEKMARKKLDVLPIYANAFENNSISDFIEKAYQQKQRLDILVNGAYSGPTPEIDDMTINDIDEGFHNGASSYMITAQHAAKYMKQDNEGSIINIASMYGMVSCYPDVYEGLMSPNSIVYQTAKAAVIQMTKYMAVFWAKNKIRVNAISPGPFPTEITQNKHPEFIKRLNSKSPLGRIGQPDEICGAVLFLASKASSYVTGQNVAVDGGWTAW